MTFHLRECRTWVRTSTHTVIPEGDPDFERLVGSDGGYMQRVLRFWVADSADAQHLRAYLGCITVSRG
ncbi:MAG: hypothetical protein U1E73_03300 [Planctomycetota bacterium]